MLRFCLSALLAVTVCLFAGAVSAQGIDPTKIKEIPHFTTLSDADFEAQTDLHTVTPPDDKFLAYNIRLPKGWVKASGAKLMDTKQGGDEKKITHHVLGKIAKYFGPQTMAIPSYLDIDALELDFNISARNWFLNYILANGFTLMGMKEISDTRLEGIYILVRKEQSYIVRTIAEINGTRMVLTSYYMPEENWDDEKAMQEKVVQSFEFLNPEKVNIEATRTYVYLDLLRFDYPQTWQLLSPNINSIEGMDVRLIDSTDKETLNGEIDVHIESTDSDKTLAQMVQDLRGSIKNMGVEIGNVLEVPADYKFHKQVYYSRVEVYDAHGKDNEFGGQELWLAIMVEDRYYYIVSMLTPGRNTDFIKWAKNIESFRTVVQSFRL